MSKKHLVKEKLLKERIDLAPECSGCDRADVSINKCTTYVNPSHWWRNGGYCPLSSNNKPEVVVEKQKKINPLKASKRAKRMAKKK